MSDNRKHGWNRSPRSAHEGAHAPDQRGVRAQRPHLPAPRKLYSPEEELERRGIAVHRLHLHDTWAAWSPHHHSVILASGLSHAQERCCLAHELEHVIAGDHFCLVRNSLGHLLNTRQERRADILAARKLIALSDLADIRRWATSQAEAAYELDVTERMLRVRMDDLEGNSWPGTSRTAG